AIGGVIQIFTKEGSVTPRATISAAAGRNQLWQGAVGTRGSSGDLRYSANLSKLDTRGIDTLVNDDGFNADRGSYSKTSFNVSAGYRFSGGADLSVRALQSDSHNEYDIASSPDQKPYSETRLRAINATMEFPLTDSWLSQLKIGSARDASENY